MNTNISNHEIVLLYKTYYYSFEKYKVTFSSLAAYPCISTLIICHLGKTDIRYTYIALKKILRCAAKPLKER